MRYFCDCILEQRAAERGSLEFALEVMKVYEAGLALQWPDRVHKIGPVCCAEHRTANNAAVLAASSKGETMTNKIRVGIVGATVTQGGSGWGRQRPCTGAEYSA